MIKSEMRREVASLALQAEVLAEEAKALAAKLRTLEGELRNRPRATNGKRTSVRLDEPTRRYIHELHERYPAMPQHEIAKLAHTNQGRVSETLAGKRS